MNDENVPSDSPPSRPDRAERELSGRSPLVLLDFGSDGLRAGIRTEESLLRCHLHRVGLSPDSLVTVYQAGEFSTAAGRLPIFPTLLDQLGGEAPVALPGLSPDKPHNLLSDVLAKATAGLRAWWGASLDELAVLIPTSLTDLQKSLIVKNARSLGWRTVRLINKTTALGVYALEDRPPGVYLLAIFGHGPADVSVVHWQSNHLRPLMHTSRASLSGGWLDRFLIGVALKQISQRFGVRIETPLFSESDWLWLRRQVESARRQLCAYREVVLELPGNLTDGVPRDARFDRTKWLEVLDELADGFRSMVEACCNEADVQAEQLQACVLSGGLLLQHGLLARLRERCAPVPLVACPHESQLLGGCRWLAQGQDEAELKTPSSPADQVAPRELPSLDQASIRPACDEVRPQSPAAALPGGADAIIERVRRLNAGGQADEARAALEPLRQYVRVLELSLAPPEQALSVLAESRLGSASGAVTSAGKPPGEPQDAAASQTAQSGATQEQQTKQEQATRKAQRRRYLLAKDEIKRAQRALNAGKLEQAVRLSHSASSRSDDHRIFAAMIKVHLRAASKRPPQIGFFAEDRSWLLCALSDDGTNEQVQAAVVLRYMRHVEQLVELKTKEAHLQAVHCLKELSRYVGLPDQAASWLEQLERSSPGQVELTPPSFDPPS